MLDSEWCPDLCHVNQILWKVNATLQTGLRPFNLESKMDGIDSWFRQRRGENILPIVVITCFTVVAIFFPLCLDSSRQLCACKQLLIHDFEEMFCFFASILNMHNSCKILSSCLDSSRLFEKLCFFASKNVSDSFESYHVLALCLCKKTRILLWLTLCCAIKWVIPVVHSLSLSLYERFAPDSACLLSEWSVYMKLLDAYFSTVSILGSCASRMRSASQDWFLAVYCWLGLLWSPTVRPNCWWKRRITWRILVVSQSLIYPRCVSSWSSVVNLLIWAVYFLWRSHFSAHFTDCILCCKAKFCWTSIRGIVRLRSVD